MVSISASISTSSMKRAPLPSRQAAETVRRPMDMKVSRNPSGRQAAERQLVASSDSRAKEARDTHSAWIMGPGLGRSPRDPPGRRGAENQQNGAPTAPGKTFQCRARFQSIPVLKEWNEVSQIGQHFQG